MAQRLHALSRGVNEAMPTRRTLPVTVGLVVLAFALVACGAPRRQPPLSPSTLPPGARLVSLSFVDPNHGWVVAADCGDNGATPASACRALLYGTSDGGRSWSPGARILVVPRKLQFTDLSTGWLIGSIGRACGDSTCPNVVMRTTDGGRTWERASTMSAELVDMSFTSPRDGWVLGENCATRAACKPIVVSTRSGGQTWTNQELSLTGRGFRLERLGAATGWIGGFVDGRAVLLVTRDDGVRWDRLEAPCRGSALAFAFPSPERGWLFCSVDSGTGPDDGAVYRSDDGGRSWRPFGQMIMSTRAAGDDAVTAIETPATDEAWVLDQRGMLQATFDGGKTWKQALAPGVPLAATLFVDTSHGWAIGDQTIWRTADAGTSWERIRLNGR